MTFNFPVPASESLVFQMLSKAEQLKGVLRTNRVLGGARHENSAEHSWQAALTALVLRDWSNEPVDIHRVVMMLLVHDIVEVDAGDADPFDSQAMVGKAERELAAANSIFGINQDVRLDELMAAWKEFEFSDTPEARYARAIDMFMPLLLNAFHDGKVWTHEEHLVSNYIAKKKDIALGSQKLWSYALELINHSVAQGWMKAG